MRALFSALGLLLLGACSMGSEDSAPALSNGGSSSGPSDGAQSLAFVGGPVALAPRQELTLSVQASPPGSYMVRFALPSNADVSPLDAVLDRSEAETDAEGRASVVLLAPSTSTAFQVRASIAGSLMATRDFTVTDMGTATVQVQPITAGFLRPITTWVASARPDETCAERPGIPTTDGKYTGLAAAGDAPEISGVPAERPVAIRLRSGHFVGGCVSVERFPAGPADAVHSVKVTVLNRPIELGVSDLAVSLVLAPEDSAFADLHASASTSVLSTLLGSSTDDADALLDTMRSALTGDPRQQLDDARKTEGWDALVRSHWGSGAATHLRDTVGNWLAAGAEQLSTSEHLFDGNLVPIDVTSAELTPTLLAGLSPADAGLIGTALVAWSAEPDDTVHLSTDLYLSSSRFATGLAEPAALVAFGEAENAAQALALSLECDALGAELAGAGTDASLAYPDCDGQCLAQQCVDAVAAIWQRGRDATSSKPVRLAFTASGVAYVGDMAEVSGLSGEWVGKLQAGGVETNTGGPLKASEPAP